MTYFMYSSVFGHCVIHHIYTCVFNFKLLINKLKFSKFKAKNNIKI